MPETKQLEIGLLIFCHINILLVVHIIITDYTEHFDHFLIRSTMEPPPECRYPSSNGNVQIGLTTTHHSDR